MVYRIFVAVRWIGHVHLRYFGMRQQLRRRLGDPWVDRHFPRSESVRLVRASCVVLGAAIQPVHRVQVSQRTHRLRKIMSALQSLQAKEYTVNTKAGQCVLQAALTRCLRSICRHDLSPAMLESISLHQGLIQLLLSWLKHHGVQDRSMVTELPADIGWHSVAIRSEASPPNSPSDETEEFNGEPMAAALQIAESEVYSAIAEQELEILALPAAIIRSHEMLHPCSTSIGQSMSD